MNNGNVYSMALSGSPAKVFLPATLRQGLAHHGADSLFKTSGHVFPTTTAIAPSCTTWVIAALGHHPGIIVVPKDNDPTRDLTAHGIVRAMRNLLTANVPIADQYIILNHWR